MAFDKDIETRKFANSFVKGIKQSGTIPVVTGRLRDSTKWKLKGDDLLFINDPVSENGFHYASRPYEVSKKSHWYEKYKTEVRVKQNLEAMYQKIAREET